MSYQPGSRVIYRTPTAFSTPPEDYVSIQSQIGSKGEIIQINSSNPTVQLPASSSVDYLISTASSSLQHSEDFLNQSIKLLRPNSALILREPLLYEESNDTNVNIDFGLRSLRDLKLALTLAGFVDINAKQQDGEPAEIKVGSSSFKVAMYEISCKKPSWEMGSSLSLGSNSSSQSLKRKSNSLQNDKEPVVSSSKPAVWKLDDDDTIEEEFAAKPQPQSQSNGATTKNAWKLPDQDDNDDLMDEDDLLKGEDLVIPMGKKVKTKDGDDCEFGKGAVKKACKNCTCGRAESEVQQTPAKPQEVELKQVEIVKQVNSSCGNCYLGDAFRCGGCPYRGLPAFKPGEKITIQL